MRILPCSFKHFRCNVDGTSVHFIHARSARPDAIPLILIHGWPSSFLEFGEVIDALTSPPEGTTACVRLARPKTSSCA